MLSRFRILLALVIAITGLGMVAQAQTGGVQVENRTRTDEARVIAGRIDNRRAVFRRSLDTAADQSRWNSTRAGENLNQLYKDFEVAKGRLIVSTNERRNSREEGQEVLNRALAIDNFLYRNRVSGDVLDSWMNLRTELDRLAQFYNMPTRWNNFSTLPSTTPRDVRQLVTRIETRTDSFRNNLTTSLDRSRLDGTRREDNINQLVQDFEDATDRLRDRYNGRISDSTADAQEILTRAVKIDNFMNRFNVGGSAASDWQALRQDLDQLASIYSISPNWGAGGGNNGGNGGIGGNTRANRLTGTFRLDRSQSEDARTAADRVTRDLPSTDRQRVYDRLVTRLESPDMIAINRSGNNVTIASTRSPQLTFEADGRERTEQTENGRTVRVVAALNADQLSVTTTGNRDTDFTVLFDPIEGGRRLRVTRRLSSDRLNTTVEVQSVYDRTSDVAQWSVYNGSSYPTTGGTTTGDFAVPNNTELRGILNTNISTRDSRDGDRFTITVREPRQYDGAIVEGYISNVSRGGRITGRSEMTLNFDRIRLRDGRTYSFAGLVQNVRTPNGEVVNINNEGNVREDNRTTTTATRAAIGTGIGALIGAIAGGGKGAAIGAAVGAGAGAGSVYVQGRDDLNLPAGSEVTILATGPR